MSQLSHQFPDQPERWYPFGNAANPSAGLPKAKTTNEVFKELGHSVDASTAATAVMREAKTVMQEAGAEIDRLRAENETLKRALEEHVVAFESLDDGLRWQAFEPQWWTKWSALTRNARAVLKVNNP